MTLGHFIAIFVAGLAAGTINTVVGSGSLITFPTLVTLGYAPLVANVSNNIGLVPGSVSGMYGYRRELRGQARRLLRLAPMSALGGATGSLLLLALGSAHGTVPRTAFLWFAIAGVSAAYAFGYRDAVSLTTIGAGAMVALFVLDAILFTPLTKLWQAHAREIAKLQADVARGRALIIKGPKLERDWAEIVAGHGLRSGTLAEFVGLSFEYADYTMGYGRTDPGPPALVSTIKIQQAGFHEVMDTEEMYRKWFDIFRARRLLPPLQSF